MGGCELLALALLPLEGVLHLVVVVLLRCLEVLGPHLRPAADREGVALDLVDADPVQGRRLVTQFLLEPVDLLGALRAVHLVVPEELPEGRLHVHRVPHAAVRRRGRRREVIDLVLELIRRGSLLEGLDDLPASLECRVCRWVSWSGRLGLPAGGGGFVLLGGASRLDYRGG